MTINAITSNITLINLQTCLYTYILSPKRQLIILHLLFLSWKFLGSHVVNTLDIWQLQRFFHRKTQEASLGASGSCARLSPAPTSPDSHGTSSCKHSGFANSLVNCFCCYSVGFFVCFIYFTFWVWVIVSLLSGLWPVSLVYRSLSLFSQLGAWNGCFSDLSSQAWWKVELWPKYQEVCGEDLWHLSTRLVYAT